MMDQVFLVCHFWFVCTCFVSAFSFALKGHEVYTGPISHFDSIGKVATLF